MARAGSPKLVLLPGLDGTGRMFRPLLDALPPGLDRVVIAYPAETFQSCADLADLVARRISAESEVVILAESYSGLVCLELLQNRLPQIKGIIFTACFAAPPRPVLLQCGRLLPLATILRVRQPTWLIKRYCLGRDAQPATIRLFRDALAAVRPEVLAGRLRDLVEARTIPAEIAVPCCYVQATKDRLVPEKVVETFNTMAPDLDTVRIEGPHFILQARPHECAETISKFLNQHFAALR
jgi:pimeloyl-ACP methyl ester carboxylesterase